MYTQFLMEQIDEAESKDNAAIEPEVEDSKAGGKRKAGRAGGKNAKRQKPTSATQVCCTLTLISANAMCSYIMLSTMLVVSCGCCCFAASFPCLKHDSRFHQKLKKSQRMVCCTQFQVAVAFTARQSWRVFAGYAASHGRRDARLSTAGSKMAHLTLPEWPQWHAGRSDGPRQNCELCFIISMSHVMSNMPERLCNFIHGVIQVPANIKSTLSASCLGT